MDPQRTSSTTHLDVTPEGVAVHERRWPPGSSPDPAVALAARLREAAHPGVVELIDLELDPPVVRTRFVSGTTAHDLADADDPSTVASLLTALASTLADLHGRGVVHGRLTPDHVVVTPDGAPVLVGWRPHDADDPPPLPTDDVAAFGELVRTLAGSGLDETSDELRAVASRARAADPAARPSMRALADSLADVANRPPPPTVGRMILPRIAPLGHDRRHLSRRRVATAAAVVAVALGATGLGVILHRITAPTPRPRSIALSPTTESRPATTTTTSVRVSTTTDPPCDTTAEVPSQPGTRSLVDADGDGCPEWVHVDGQRIAVGDDIWSVGEPGDLVAVGASAAQLDELLDQVAACTTRGHAIRIKVGAGFVERHGSQLTCIAPTGFALPPEGARPA